MLAKKLSRRSLMTMVSAFGACAPALAQTGSSQSVLQIVVGGPPGGLFDVALRIVSEDLGRALGQTVVIENKPGAGTAVSLAYAKNAKPDGRTIVMVNVAAAANESLIKSRSYRLFDDFDPVGMYAYPTNILIVNPQLGVRDVKELIQSVRSRNGSNYSSGGIGSPGHLAGEVFKAHTGIPVTHVPYRGAPPAVLAVTSGEVDFMFSTASSTVAQIESGQVKALAVTTPERLPMFPAVPTMTEAGLTDFNVTDWTGFLAPKNTPIEVRARIRTALDGAFTGRENQDKLRKAAFIPINPPLGPDQFDMFMRQEVGKWAKVIAEAGITAQ